MAQDYDVVLKLLFRSKIEPGGSSDCGRSRETMARHGAAGDPQYQG
jgi:hypothetical protein